MSSRHRKISGGQRIRCFEWCEKIVCLTTERVVRELDFSKKLFIGAVALMASVAPILLGQVNETPSPLSPPRAPSWQTAAGGKMAFDVASVKLNASEDQVHANVSLSDLDDYAPNGGLFSAGGITLS